MPSKSSTSYRALLPVLSLKISLCKPANLEHKKGSTCSPKLYFGSLDVKISDSGSASFTTIPPKALLRWVKVHLHRSKTFLNLHSVKISFLNSVDISDCRAISLFEILPSSLFKCRQPSDFVVR